MKLIQKKSGTEVQKPQMKAGTERILDPQDTDRFWKELYSIVNRYGPTASKCEFVVSKKARHISGAIDPKDWNLRIVFPENLHFGSDKNLERFLSKMNVQDPFMELLRDVSKHECGHWEFPRGSGFGCPKDNVLYHECFLNPVFEELEKSGKLSKSSCKMWASRITNAVMDIIDNYNVFVKSRGTNGTGQVLFWYLAGQNASQNNGTFTAEYTLFVKCNLMLMHNGGEANDLLERFFVKGGVDKNGTPVDLEKKAGEAASRLKAVLAPENMLAQENWEGIARAYAKEVLEFIDEQAKPEQPTSGGDKTGKSKPQKSGKSGQESGEEEEDSEKSEEEGEESEEEEDKEGSDSGQEEGEEEDESEGGSDQEESEEGEESGEEPGQGEEEDEAEEEDSSPEEGAEEEERSPFGKLSRQDVEQIMVKRAQRGEGIPFYLDKDGALDGMYRSLSKTLRINTKHGKLPASRYPVVDVRRRNFDPRRDAVSDLSFRKIGIDYAQRRAVPTVVTHRHEIDLPVRKTLRGFPEVAFALIDSSGSMLRNGNTNIIPWGDRSGYHYALLAFYGMLRQLELLGVAHKVKFSGAVFNDSTSASSGLDNVKRMLFNPTTGSTYIDMDVVKRMLSGKEGALFPFISDGGIDNWDSIKDEFIALAKKQQFFMVLVGGENDTSKDLRAAGLLVKPVDSYADVVKMVVDLTAERYSHVIQEKLKREAMKMHR